MSDTTTLDLPKEKLREKMTRYIDELRDFYNSHHEFETISGRAPRDIWMLGDQTKIPEDIRRALIEHRKTEMAKQEDAQHS